MPLMLQPLAKFAVFSGRARRSEFWLFFLLQAVIYITLMTMGALSLGRGLVGIVAMTGIARLLGLAFLVPNLAVATRRLHDTGRPVLWLILWAPGLLAEGLQTAEMILGHSVAPPAALFGPIVGLVSLAADVVMLVLMALKGQAATNAYGPDPKSEAGDTATLPQAEPHESVFDFSAVTKPAPRNIAPLPTRPFARAASGPSTPPTFGKRR